MRFDSLLEYTSIEPNVFCASVPKQGWRRVFGGHLLAQLLGAAIRTVEPERRPHNIHVNFLRSGQLDCDIQYQVSRTQDGGRFSIREVKAFQAERLLAHASVSFQVFEPGLNYHTKMPETASPDGLHTEAEIRAEVASNTPDATWTLSPVLPDLPVELRPLQQDRELIDPEPCFPPRLDYWVRPNQHIAPANTLPFIACLSDIFLLASTLLPHGLTWNTTPIEGSTLVQDLWIHMVPKLDQWLLWSTECHWTGQTRGLARGTLWTESGELVATAMQEGLIRLS